VTTTATSTIAAWLAAQLAHGAVRPRELRDRAARAGLDARHLDAAKRRIGAVSVQDDVGTWRWTLPHVPARTPIDAAVLAAAYDQLVTTLGRVLPIDTSATTVERRDDPSQLSLALRLGHWHDADDTRDLIEAVDTLDHDLGLVLDALATINAARRGGTR
jgi:hypothetical protein